MVRMVPESERPKRSRATTTTTTSPARVVQQRREARAVVADPEELVGEHALAAGGGQRVTLLVEGLLVGADPGVAGSRYVALRRIDVPYDALNGTAERTGPSGLLGLATSLSCNITDRRSACGSQVRVPFRSSRLA